MATFVQRWQSVGDALLNTVASVTQLGRLATAVCFHQGRLADYIAAPTNAAKAEVAVQCLRSLLLAVVKNYESEAAVMSARQSAAVTVDTDFAGTP